ncbi:MAG: hypothetical protein JXQ73_30160 [Phycisphaerae bacterium]|nr:hypothetical protein [Phycisphaerae bacterium]
MMRHLTCSLAFGLVVLFVAPETLRAEAKPPESNIVVVQVEGEGTDKQSAKAAALRKAVEQGGKQEIAAFSQAENYVLIRDTIYSRSEGIVVDYKILKEEEGTGGSFFCKIEAKVDKTAIATKWGEVQNLLDSIGRPKIMVYVQERIDGAMQRSSIIESKIEERLVKAGFDVVARTAMEEIAKKEKADAAAEDDIKKVQAIAKGFNAQIYIIGHSNADFVELADLYGAKAAMYNCDAVAKCYYTSTGRLIASESVPVQRGGARGNTTRSPQAARATLAKASETLIDKMYATVMMNWATQVSHGGEVMLEVSAIKFAQANKLKKMLGEAKDVKTVHMKFSKGIATYRMVATKTGEELAGVLAEGPWAEIMEIQDVTISRIQAKGKGGE